MKDWEKPRLETVDFSDTGFGPNNKTIPDSEKSFLYDEEVGGYGWVQQYGEVSA